MKVSDHKCIKCNAELKFNPEKQKWICEYCGEEYNINELNDIMNNKKNGAEEVIYKRIYMPRLWS